MPEDPRPSGWFCWLCLREVATLIWVTLGNTKAAPICAGCASRLPSCQVYTPEEFELARGLKKGAPARVPAPLAKKLVEAGWAEVLAPGQDGEKADSPAPGQAAQERGGREGASEQGEEGRGVRVWNPFQCPACGKYLHWRKRAHGFVCKNPKCENYWKCGVGAGVQAQAPRQEMRGRGLKP